MKTRREFLAAAAFGTAALPLRLPAQAADAPQEPREAPHGQVVDRDAYRPGPSFGLGGVAIGNAFEPSPDAQALAALDAAWEAGVRYYDTAPFYGFGLSERRFGLGLDQRPKDEYIISTKVGRLLVPDENPDPSLWHEVPKMSPKFDYTGGGARRSVEDSLQRLGIPSIDIVFIHDLSPDHLGGEWLEQFEIAKHGAMVELTKMRDEGLIKGWGLGVNRAEPILRTMEVADADVFLFATQYSIVQHEDALERVLPKIEEAGLSLVLGAPLNSGFLAGRERYNYSPKIPEGMHGKRERISKVAEEHGTDLRTAALQFCAAPSMVSVVIPGARSPEQVKENAASMEAEIPAEFWETLKKENLIAKNAPVPG